MNKIDKEYFIWLCDAVLEEDGPDKTSLLKYLYNKEFVWIMPMDENRAGDGIWLRREFLSDTDYSPEHFEGKPCSVLEMLVALSIRIEDSIMYDWETGDRTGYWFWLIVNNLGLDDDMDERSLDRVLDIFMNRRYLNGGLGCPFPMPVLSSKEFENFKQEELWTQVLDYLRFAFNE